MKTILVSFVAAALTLSARANYYPEWVLTGFSKQTDVISLAAADFTGDGRPDTIALSARRWVFLMPTDTDGKPGARTTVWTGEGLADIAVADFDGDAKKDVVIAAPEALLFLRSNGDGTFAAPVTTSLDFVPWELAAEDFTGDGLIDVAVWGYHAKTLAVFRGNGTGSFTEASRMTVAPSWSLIAGDVDGDSRIDVLLEREDLPLFELLYGKGDGSFEVSVTFPKPRLIYLVHCLIADVDGDGDGEILYVDSVGETLAVLMNLGSRTFAAPSLYQLFVPPPEDGAPSAIAVTDVDGDGKRDILVTLANARHVVTLAGNGDGSVATPVAASLVVPGVAVLPRHIVAADFTGDGRPDVAVGSYAGVAIFRNATGEVAMRLVPRHRVISTGQSAAFRVWVDVADGHYPAGSAPRRMGTVTLEAGADVVGSGTLQYDAVEIEAASLPVGIHTIAARYAGDAAYRSAVSSGVVQQVVAEKTTSSLSSGLSGPIPYGMGFTLRATVVSQVAGDLAGSFWPFIDGVRQEFTLPGPPMSWNVNWLRPGTHTFYVEYDGTATQPPSRSNVITQVITKAQSTTEINISLAAIPAGEALGIRVRLGANPHGGRPSGWVRVYEGTRLLAKAFVTESGGEVAITLPSFTTEGTHQIHATYAGDENYEASVSPLENVVVTAGAVAPRRRPVRH